MAPAEKLADWSRSLPGGTPTFPWRRTRRMGLLGWLVLALAVGCAAPASTSVRTGASEDRVQSVGPQVGLRGPDFKELPVIQAAYERERGTGFIPLLVNLQEDRATVQRFASRLGLTAPILLDMSGDVLYDVYRVEGTRAR